MPQPMVDWMLTNKVYLRPGTETSMLDSALPMYRDIAGEHLEIDGKAVLIFGYGGTYGLALSLLEAGARHVHLHDPYAGVRHALNKRLPAERMSRFFALAHGNWIPDQRHVTPLTRQLPDLTGDFSGAFDVVLSNSVFEHVEEVDANIRACAAVTKPGGYNLHLIDLRDHFFKYPFEMLRYSESAWRGWLNASNNLNRWRFRDFERSFKASFERCDIRPRRLLRDEFAAMRQAIRPEFISGDDEIDAIGTMIAECWRAAEHEPG